MPPISILIKPVSGLCNLRCSYCFYADEMKHRKKSSYGIMSLQTLEQVIKKTLACAESSCSIAFQGGEPTLAGQDFYRSCLEFETKYNINHVQISHSIQTNGFLLDKEWCRFLSENHFLTGLSIDGIKTSHDAYRKDSAGNGTYFHTLHAAELLKQSGADFNILTVVNKKTASKIGRIYESYKKNGFLWQQYIACLDPIGTAYGMQEYSLTPQSYGQFLIDLFRLWAVDFYHGRQPYIRQFENYIGILMGIFPESCEQKGICTVQNVIEADGSVYPCDFYALDEYRLGNLTEDTFKQIQEREAGNLFIRQSLNHTEECQKCPYLPLCRGGCRKHREQTGATSGRNYFCESYKMFFRECLPELKKIAFLCAARAEI